MKLSIGDSAPDFSAFDQNERQHNLSDFIGSWLVLYFYPRDNTPGCIREACGIRDSYGELTEYTSVVGVSSNSIDSHKKFAEKFDLPFTLLADPEKKMLDSYGANGLVLAKRTTFVINPEGEIARIFEKVSPDIHAKELIDFLASQNIED